MSLTEKQLALFSNGIYKKKSLKYINKNVYDGWTLDKENSKVDSKVFVHNDNKIIVVVFRGTTNLKDVKDDLSILTSREYKNKRWQKARKLVKKVNEKYKPRGFLVYVVGHSLGASLAEFSSRHTGNETVGFSRGNLKIGQNIKNPNYKDVYNKYDPISGLVSTHKGATEHKKADGINKHSMINFV